MGQMDQLDSDPFVQRLKLVLLNACILYVLKHRPKEDQNFSSVMKLLRAAEVDENNPNAKTVLDKLFEEVEREDPDSAALKQYRIFRLGSGRMANIIAMRCLMGLNVFNLEKVDAFTKTDTLELDRMSQDKTVLFILPSIQYDEFDLFADMLLFQLSEIFHKGYTKYDNLTCWVPILKN